MNAEVLAATVTAVPATLIAIAGYYVSRNQNQLEIKRAQRELFESYNNRFDRMNEYLNAIRDNTFIPVEDKTQKGIIQDYLNLCSEEYLWYKSGLIGEEVWSVWLDGINGYLKVVAIAEVFAYERRTAPNSYSVFFKCYPWLEAAAAKVKLCEPPGSGFALAASKLPPPPSPPLPRRSAKTPGATAAPGRWGGRVWFAVIKLSSD